MSYRLTVVLASLVVAIVVSAPAAADDPSFDPYNRSPEEAGKELTRVPPLELTDEEIDFHRQRLEKTLGMRKGIWAVDDFEDGDLDGWIDPNYPTPACPAQATSPGARPS